MEESGRTLSQPISVPVQCLGLTDTNPLGVRDTLSGRKPYFLRISESVLDENYAVFLNRFQCRMRKME